VITTNITQNLAKSIETAVKIINQGGLVVFPSDTVYILAVDPTNQKAVEKLLAFKDRWTGKAISIAVLDKNMAMDYVDLSTSAENIYQTLLPGPFTIVSDGKHKTAMGIESENGTLGIRIPDNKYIRELVGRLGKPVTATSANLSGRTPNYSIQSFLRPLSKKKLIMIDLIVDAGKLPKNKPSTVIDTTKAEIEILRRGDLIAGTGETLISNSVKETEKIAEFVLKKILDKQIEKPIVFGLSGELGCGKTVFSRKIGNVIGVEEKITSPTFFIYNEYKLKGEVYKKFLHFDLYRLTGKEEFKEIDFLGQFQDGVIACVEWPENMGKENFLKLKKIVNYVPVHFKYLEENTREISF
jgi:L-threonylcarbamoyladenylate synthase